ncbi:hypothetical protein [Caballeronia sp. HLA56]
MKHRRETLGEIAQVARGFPLLRSGAIRLRLLDDGRKLLRCSRAISQACGHRKAWRGQNAVERFLKAQSALRAVPASSICVPKGGQRRRPKRFDFSLFFAQARARSLGQLSSVAKLREHRPQINAFFFHVRSLLWEKARPSLPSLSSTCCRPGRPHLQLALRLA